MKINPHIFRGYDLRGLVGEDLSPELAMHLGKAFGTFLKRDGIDKAVVAYDSRETGPTYSANLIKGLAWSGINVIDIGMQMVGNFYWAQHYYQSRGGVFVTASHNPAEYNGFKFANDYSETLVSNGMQEMRRLVEEEDYEQAISPGSITKEDVKPLYFDDLLQRLKITHKLRVAIDSSCATSGNFAPELLRRAGCEVIEFNTTVNSSFPLGSANPLESKVITRLSKNVIKCKADVGFTYDADGDRIGIVDENGGIIFNDVLVAIFASDVLCDHPGEKIMYNTLCSKVVSETITKQGGEPFMWRTGHSFLKKKNQEVKAAFIGELSGHFFFSADFYNHDDGLYSTLRLLHYMSRTGKKLSEIVKELPKYISSPEMNVFCADEKKVEFMKALDPVLKKDFPRAELIDDDRAGDGLRLELPDGMFVIRYSQNGPYLAIKFESKTKEGYEKLRQYIWDTLHDYPELDWESYINLNLEALENSLP